MINQPQQFNVSTRKSNHGLGLNHAVTIRLQVWIYKTPLVEEIQFIPKERGGKRRVNEAAGVRQR